MLTSEALVGNVVRALTLVHEVLLVDEMVNRVEFL